MAITLTADFLWDITTDKQYKVKVSSFGDGYEEISAPMSINTITTTHNIKFFFRTFAAFKAFVLTLDENRGAPVLFQHPLDTALTLYRVMNYSLSLQSPTYSEVSVTLKKWFGSTF